MELQRLYSLTRKALDEYKMISEGDRIAIGVSGGKDSLTLLYALAGIRNFYPLKFELHAYTVDLGFKGFSEDLEPIEMLCSKLSVPYTVLHTDISEIVFDIRKEENPCSLCSKMRKGALANGIKKDGCNKIAYAHHRDDLIDTLLMSIIFEGRIRSFMPVTYLDRTGLTVIRPLLYIPEADIIGFRNKYSLPVVKNPCPNDGNSKRTYINELIKKLEKENPGTRKRIFNAVISGCFNIVL